MDFTPFPKISRMRRGAIVTEKIDGTNAQVNIRTIRDTAPFDPDYDVRVDTADDAYYVRAGSRTRWVHPGADNFGFAAWVRHNATALAGLGVGAHFGEWWGHGIQRGYGITERRFSLFNTARWRDPERRPACCDVVPVLFAGKFDSVFIDGIVLGLKHTGSVAAPGFKKPEGVVVWHEAARQLFKVTCDNDNEPKGQGVAA